MSLSLQETSLTGWLAELSFKSLREAEGGILEIPENPEALEAESFLPEEIGDCEDFKPQISKLSSQLGLPSDIVRVEDFLEVISLEEE